MAKWVIKIALLFIVTCAAVTGESETTPVECNLNETLLSKDLNNEEELRPEVNVSPESVSSTTEGSPTTEKQYVFNQGVNFTNAHAKYGNYEPATREETPIFDRPPLANLSNTQPSFEFSNQQIEPTVQNLTKVQPGPAQTVLYTASNKSESAERANLSSVIVVSPPIQKNETQDPPQGNDRKVVELGALAEKSEESSVNQQGVNQIHPLLMFITRDENDPYVFNVELRNGGNQSLISTDIVEQEGQPSIFKDENSGQYRLSTAANHSSPLTGSNVYYASDGGLPGAPSMAKFSMSRTFASRMPFKIPPVIPNNPSKQVFQPPTFNLNRQPFAGPHVPTPRTPHVKTLPTQRIPNRRQSNRGKDPNKHKNKTDPDAPAQLEHEYQRDGKTNKQNSETKTEESVVPSKTVHNLQSPTGPNHEPLQDKVQITSNIVENIAQPSAHAQTNLTTLLTQRPLEGYPGSYNPGLFPGSQYNQGFSLGQFQGQVSQQGTGQSSWSQGTQINAQGSVQTVQQSQNTLNSNMPNNGYPNGGASFQSQMKVQGSVPSSPQGIPLMNGQTFPPGPVYGQNNVHGMMPSNSYNQPFDSTQAFGGNTHNYPSNSGMHSPNSMLSPSASYSQVGGYDMGYNGGNQFTSMSMQGGMGMGMQGYNSPTQQIVSDVLGTVRQLQMSYPHSGAQLYPQNGLGTGFGTGYGQSSMLPFGQSSMLPSSPGLGVGVNSGMGYGSDSTLGSGSGINLGLDLSSYQQQSGNGYGSTGGLGLPSNIGQTSGSGVNLGYGSTGGSGIPQNTGQNFGSGLNSGTTSRYGFGIGTDTLSYQQQSGNGYGSTGGLGLPSNIGQTSGSGVNLGYGSTGGSGIPQNTGQNFGSGLNSGTTSRYGFEIGTDTLSYQQQSGNGYGSTGGLGLPSNIGQTPGSGVNLGYGSTGGSGISQNTGQNFGSGLNSGTTLGYGSEVGIDTLSYQQQLGMGYGPGSTLNSGSRLYLGLDDSSSQQQSGIGYGSTGDLGSSPYIAQTSGSGLNFDLDLSNNQQQSATGYESTAESGSQQNLEIASKLGLSFGPTSRFESGVATGTLNNQQQLGTGFTGVGQTEVWGSTPVSNPGFESNNPQYQQQNSMPWAKSQTNTWQGNEYNNFPGLPQAGTQNTWQGNVNGYQDPINFSTQPQHSIQGFPSYNPQYPLTDGSVVPSQNNFRLPNNFNPQEQLPDHPSNTSQPNGNLPNQWVSTTQTQLPYNFSDNELEALRASLNNQFLTQEQESVLQALLQRNHRAIEEYLNSRQSHSVQSTPQDNVQYLNCINRAAGNTSQTNNTQVTKSLQGSQNGNPIEQTQNNQGSLGNSEVANAPVGINRTNIFGPVGTDVTGIMPRLPTNVSQGMQPYWDQQYPASGGNGSVGAGGGGRGGGFSIPGTEFVGAVGVLGASVGSVVNGLGGTVGSFTGAVGGIAAGGGGAGGAGGAGSPGSGSTAQGSGQFQARSENVNKAKQGKAPDEGTNNSNRGQSRNEDVNNPRQEQNVDPKRVKKKGRGNQRDTSKNKKIEDREDLGDPTDLISHNTTVTQNDTDSSLQKIDISSKPVSLETTRQKAKRRERKKKRRQRKNQRFEIEQLNGPIRINGIIKLDSKQMCGCKKRKHRRKDKKKGKGRKRKNQRQDTAHPAQNQTKIEE